MLPSRIWLRTVPILAKLLQVSSMETLRFTRRRSAFHTAECIDRLLHINEGWEERLHNQIRISDYTPEDLLGFAYDRIEAEDYAIDKPALIQTLCSNHCRAVIL